MKMEIMNMNSARTRGMRLSGIAALLLLGLSAFGQQRRVMHQTYDLNGIASVQFDIKDNYEVELWAGTVLLIETTVEMREINAKGKVDAPESIFKHFVDKGRYQTAGALLNGNQLRVQSKDMQRAAIRTKTGECSEEVLVKIMLPDSFQKTGDHIWTRSGKE